ncbi:MAG: TolC family protein [Magnetococcales bacterium]|nr:TolC family protein [Magnetococcales bacterium]
MVILLTLTGCGSLSVNPLTRDEITSISLTDRRAAQAGVEPLKGVLSLEEAIARALKYNLDRRTKMMEEAIALNQLDLSSYDMLPKLIASAGYQTRNKDIITTSKDSVTGQPSLAHPYVSSERSHTLADVGLTWNLLDFGVGYYGAKQQADRVLIAGEQRRKAMHTLIQDVRSAFWRAASAQKLQGDVRNTIKMAEEALMLSRRAEVERLRSPVDSLRYQRQVLENLRLLESIDQELSSARVELASLINSPLSSDIRVVEPNDTVTPDLLAVPVQRMEELAIAQNAELRAQFYTSRIATEEVKKTMLKLFPGLSFNYNVKYDTDKFLINNNWNNAGLQLSFNLFNLWTGPTQIKLAEAGVSLADQHRVATQMAILTQVHLSRIQYANSYRLFERADAIWRVDDKIFRHMSHREQAETQSKLDSIANSTTAILSLLRRYQALSQVHIAASKVEATLGMEPNIGSVQDYTLSELTQVIRAATQKRDNLEPIREPIRETIAMPMSDKQLASRVLASSVTLSAAPPIGGGMVQNVVHVTASPPPPPSIAPELPKPLPRVNYGRYPGPKVRPLRGA